MGYILAIDQGTSSSRAIIFDEDLYQVASAQKPFKQIYPKPGWVEHDPNEIVLSVMFCVEKAIQDAKISFKDIEAIGITNQRETIVAWDAETGKALYNAIVWQCRRTADRAKELERQYRNFIHSKTGLLPDPYFSATKMEWMLKNVPEVRKAAKKGTLRFGTIDSWLIWNLTPDRQHVTDHSNASRTMLYNLNELKWDEELLEFFGIEKEFLPKVVDSSKLLIRSVYGPVISGIAGDQQASLFGQTAFNVGDVKCTYGTGSFILMNTGDKPRFSREGLLTTVGWKINDEIVYAIEGSIFTTGALINWLKDGLQIISTPEETELLATSVEDNGGVYFSGALAGLGAPYWDSKARGLIIGLTRGATRAHIVRAVLEYIAFRTKEILEIMERDTGIKVNRLLVDGGVTRNNFLMELQSKVLGVTVDRPIVKETTALGAAMLAGLAVGLWDKETLAGIRKSEVVFTPTRKELEDEYKKWKEAIKRSMNWAE
ncbi:glycerol kinase GlpK [Kosmotoga sp. DU53]|uniref:glycerol kinase GlpK n=1 Tax=Kosmotoga sp. DU53 TaxID=1310160 RepID=UPI0007C512EF|nr:glycerol kinase GlpK [Kosmotoga sp. DU53]OAA23292.1 carbohydrate kinase [Kosmotoga sp. DU53]